MKIKTKHGKFEVNPITFNDQCEMEGALADISVNGQSTRSLFKFYGWVGEKAFSDPKKVLKKYKIDEKYTILAEIANEYLGLGKDPLEKGGD